jgi:outer membrane protein OmpA-like peptidoglycan-associated protein
MDIWYFTRNRNGDMKGPNCMPKPINTVGNEHTPSYDNNKHILYFSSDGHPGFGGFDVFSATQAEDMTWQKPVNIGRPVNSEDDDLYYTPIQGNVYNAGYMVSNRKGTTELNSPTASDDIFRFEDFKYGLEGMITRADGDGSPVKDARVFLYVKDASGNDSLAAIDSSVTPQGTYFFKLHPDLDYKVVVERAGFSPKEEFISTKDLPMEDTLQKDFSINMNVVNVHGKIYRDVDPSMTALKDVTIIISEKTKTGLHLVSTYSTSDTNPNFASNLEKGKIYTIAFRKNGYFAKSMEIDPRDFGNVFDVTKDIPVTMMEMDKSYTLSNIYYEFGKATLTASSEKVLDELKNLLDENPSIIIELSSHTDSKGADGFNMLLSQKRAESCVNYLLSKGVLKKRMIAKGYGESKPLVPNTTPDGQDDEEGRAKNRRTEFKIVGELKSNVKVGYQDKDGVKK